MEWDYSILNTPRKEERYRLNNWIITWDSNKEEGYISHLNRVTIIETFSKGGEIVKGLGIPNYVVDKVNELISERRV